MQTAAGNSSAKSKFQNSVMIFNADMVWVWTLNFKSKACWHTGFLIDFCYDIHQHFLKVFLSQKQNSFCFLKPTLLLQGCQEKSYRLRIRVCAF